jgi:hypothetical protein
MKKVIAIGIIIILIVVGLCGCNESNISSSDDINRFIGTWEYVDTTIFFIARYTFFENGTAVFNSSFMYSPYWYSYEMYNSSNMYLQYWCNYEIRNGKLCFEYIDTNFSGCGTYKFSKDYSLLTMESIDKPGHPVIFRRISYGISDKEQFKINRFDISPSVINKDEKAVLTWDVSNADSVSINSGIGIVELNGSMIVSPIESTVFLLTAIKDNMTLYSNAFIGVLIQDAHVAVEGTDNQIKLVLGFGGDDYDDGYTISGGVDNEVSVFINGSKAILTPGLWETGGQLLLGLNGATWTQGSYTCPKDYYEVTVAINNTVVFDGTIRVGSWDYWYASVAGEGTDNQIKLVLTSGGDDYGDGYNIANDVDIYIMGYKVSSYSTTVWEVSGQLLLGLSESDWIEGGTCPKDDYEVTIVIKGTVVFDGTIRVG